MAKVNVSIPQGTRDFGPETVRKRNYIFDTIRNVFELYGFQPLETPAMENLETVLPAGVQVTQIQPVRAKNGQITLQLRVLGPRDLSVELVRNLEHSKRFLRPRISGESAESSGGSTKLVSE